MNYYLAGKMRGLPAYGFPAFHAAAKDLRAMGYKVMSPAEHDEETGFDPKTDDEADFDVKAAMRWDLGCVLKADAVVVLPGWEGSEGVTIEMAVARAIGTPVLDYPYLKPIESEPVTAEALRLVCGPRQGAYGHPHSDFSRTGRMWGAILGLEDDIDPALVGLCMAAVKISREVNTPKRDNLVDLAGYAETVWLVRQRQAEVGQ